MTIEKKDGPEKVKLTELEATKLALAAERVGNAQTLVSARQSELQLYGAELVKKYGEGGKYNVTGVDPGTGELTREPFPVAADEQAGTTNGAAESAAG